MKINLLTKYFQNDPQFSSHQLGSSTIGLIGCLLCDITNILNLFGHNINPNELADWLRDNQGLSGNFFKWDAIPRLYSDIKLGGVIAGLTDPLTKSQMDAIRNKVDKGWPVLLQIDTIPSTSDLDEHWVDVVDYDGDDFIVFDPWDGATKRITSWGVAPQNLIYAYAWYEGKQTVVETLISIATNLYELLVKKSTQWDKTASKYVPSKDPKDTLFEDVQSVVAGYLSLATTAQTNEGEARKLLALALTEVENQKDKVANIQSDCQKTIQLKQAEIDTLTESGKTTDKLKGQYESTIVNLQGELRESQKQVGLKELQITSLESENNTLLKNQSKTYKVGQLLSMIWEKVKTLDIKL